MLLKEDTQLEKENLQLSDQIKSIQGTINVIEAENQQKQMNI